MLAGGVDTFGATPGDALATIVAEGSVGAVDDTPADRSDGEERQLAVANCVNPTNSSAITAAPLLQLRNELVSLIRILPEIVYSATNIHSNSKSVAALKILPGWRVGTDTS